ncbi:uncharacterized protein BP01DRAFT_338992 [Aspergillus saccharolyticus JOP 1030-1]|uniref:Bactericidal permeability-increasing protein n=1 Tax=Aspergillus saccharolyticus JOP 1030-1 TaxID=1450539 RepID=A0A318ZEJ1_9EURO|nr:hypothetical protein BP01DRAFT_338992 [Aspergillus saccharolyticus JOP 1030-1]PYH45829.1 hypothetical protein BP01DRAFT_338992 [Aspergillus saccharolyticus JOP 1030-1]
MPQGETEPLLPRYEEDTTLQRRLHQKLHTYQMLRALSDGYMPSTEQVIVNLRTLLASDVLSTQTHDVGSVGRQIIRDCRLWIQVFIEFLKEKNEDDKLQEFLWHLARSRASIDPNQIQQQAHRSRVRADTKAAYDSLRTVGSLLLTNSDFRLFVEDLSTVGRQIFSDTAFSLSSATQQIGEQLKPSEEEIEAVQKPGADEGHTPTGEDLRHEATEVAEIAGNGLARTGKDAVSSAKEHLAGREKEALLYRLKQTVLKLKDRTDYSDSISTLGQLIRRYAQTYVNAASDVVTAAEEDVEVNADLKQAMQQFWVLLQSFGDAEEWKALEQRFETVLQHANTDPEFEKFLSETGSVVQEMLTDPKFFDNAEEKFDELKEKSKEVKTESRFRQDVDAFLVQAKRALRTVPGDKAVANLVNATSKLYKDIWEAYHSRESQLPADLLESFLPLVLRTVQFIPIPRLEISAPEVDLLLESLILEPGRTVNYSSFLPYRMHVTTRNDIDILKKHSKKTATDIKTTFTATVNGLNISASEFGYWIRTHSGPFLRFKDEGVASFFLDKRGVDISLDIEVGRERLEQIFTLRGVRVQIHKLDYKVHRSRWKWLLWLTKPFLKHLVRRVLEKKIAEKIVQAAFALNRELVFARERLRAARIANPQDLASFVRAVLARLKALPESDVEARVGLEPPGEGVFKGVYAPGSLVKVWHQEATRAEEAIEEGDESRTLAGTWRNEIFDVPVRRA